MVRQQPGKRVRGTDPALHFSLTGPLVEGLSYRLSGNLNKTDADDPGLNSAYATETTITPTAGKEGVRNRDLNGLLRWDLNAQQTLEVEGSYSRQGNIYAGDRAVSSTGSELLNELIGRETNIMYRRAGSITHRGNWDWGSSQLVFSYENTRNRRLNEGLAGSSEGSINTGDMSTSEYDNYALSGELNIPFTFGFSQVATLGFEYTKEVLDDPYSVTQSTTNGGALPGTGSGPRDSEATNENIAFFAESNMHLTERWTLTPGLRFDNHTQFGSNWSPSLNGPGLLRLGQVLLLTACQEPSRHAARHRLRTGRALSPPFPARVDTALAVLRRDGAGRRGAGHHPALFLVRAGLRPGTGRGAQRRRQPPGTLRRRRLQSAPHRPWPHPGAGCRAGQPRIRRG
nr:TonB-dependent receptor [Azotobacter chroococcum]